MKRSWPATILAFVMALIGIVLAIGGAWLLILGGSPYYLIAGLALLASGWFLLKGRLLGGWIYIGLFILSAIWGFAESRGNAWAMIPWLVAPLVILILVLLVMPTLTRATNRWKLAGGGIALGVLFVAASFAILGANSDTAALALPAQSAPGMTDPSGQSTGADWPAYGGTNAAWRYSPLTQINASNVGNLQKVWEVHTGGLPTNPDYAKLYGTENTPLKVGNLLYTCTAKNVILALDAATGKPVWRVDPQVPDKWIPYTTACRGVAYYQLPGAAAGTLCAGRIIEGTLDSRLIAVDALTGKPCTDFNGTGQQDTKIGMGPVYPGLASINSAPTIVRGIIVVPHQILDGQCRCSPSGVIQGFDAQDRQARLGMGHAAPRLARLSARRADMVQRHAQQLDHERRRREARTRLRADRQRRRRLYLHRPNASGECVLELAGRNRRHHRQAALELPDGPQGRVGL